MVASRVVRVCICLCWAQEEENLREALRFSAAMLSELRTSQLSPQKYYELYMLAFDQLVNLEVGATVALRGSFHAQSNMCAPCPHCAACHRAHKHTKRMADTQSITGKETSIGACSAASKPIRMHAEAPLAMHFWVPHNNNKHGRTSYCWQTSHGERPL